MKQAAKEKARRRHTPAPTRPRKPDLQVYLDVPVTVAAVTYAVMNLVMTATPLAMVGCGFPAAAAADVGGAD
mgnify:CR=1 FL=1